VGGGATQRTRGARPPGGDPGACRRTPCAAGGARRTVRQRLRTVRGRLFDDGTFLLQARVGCAEPLQCLGELCLLELRLRTLGAVIFPDPGVQGVCMHAQGTCGLGTGLLRLNGQFDCPLLELCGLFCRRGLAHRTHLVGCVSSVSPCVR
jgi:hypothetical protein